MYVSASCLVVSYYSFKKLSPTVPLLVLILSSNSDCPLSDSSNSVSIGCGCLSSCIFYGYSLFLIPILFLLYCLTHNVLCIFRNILIIISFTIKRPKHKATKKNAMTSICQQSQYPVFPIRSNKWYKVLATTI